MQINLNTSYEMHLSLSDIEEYCKALDEYKKKLPSIAQNIVKRVSEIGLQDNHKSTELLPVVTTGGKVTGGIHTTDEIDTYREYGTGIVGSNNPHPDVMSGWIYDVNNHGEKGWKYPKGDGTYGWTRGIPASRKFYNAMIKMEEAFPSIAQEEFRK